MFATCLFESDLLLKSLFYLTKSLESAQHEEQVLGFGSAFPISKPGNPVPDFGGNVAKSGDCQQKIQYLAKKSTSTQRRWTNINCQLQLETIQIRYQAATQN